MAGAAEVPPLALSTREAVAEAEGVTEVAEAVVTVPLITTIRPTGEPVTTDLSTGLSRDLVQVPSSWMLQ